MAEDSERDAGDIKRTRVGFAPARPVTAVQAASVRPITEVQAPTLRPITEVQVPATPAALLAASTWSD